MICFTIIERQIINDTMQVIHRRICSGCARHFETSTKSQVFDRRNNFWNVLQKNTFTYYEQIKCISKINEQKPDDQNEQEPDDYTIVK